jgi:protein phosphatase
VRITQAVAATHPGRQREHNEDAVLRLVQVPVFVVADGMGGPGGGDVAAAIALKTVRRFVDPLVARNEAVAQDRATANRLALGNLLDELFNAASHEIFAEAQKLKRPGIGATMVLATVVRNYAYIAHIGDTRAYLYRQGRVVRLTEDHSLAEFKYRRGRISREEYEVSPDRQILYQALGAGVEVDVDLAQVRLSGGDGLLLCSDGLVRAVDEASMAANIDLADIARSMRRLVALANKNGAPDNVSAILIGFDADQTDEPIEAITGVMRQVFLFSELSEQERLIIAPYLEEVVFAKGATVTSEGDPADTFYVVVSGRLRVTSQGTHLTDVKEGGHFGELALARPSQRSATVRALTDTKLLGLSRTHFHELLRHKPELGARLAISLLDAVGERLRDLSDRLTGVIRAAKGDVPPV